MARARITLLLRSAKKKRESLPWRVSAQQGTQQDTPGGDFGSRLGGGLHAWAKRRIWLRLADLSRTPRGTFFREVHPASEMGGKNGPNGPFCPK